MHLAICAPGKSSGSGNAILCRLHSVGVSGMACGYLFGAEEAKCLPFGSCDWRCFDAYVPGGHIRVVLFLVTFCHGILTKTSAGLLSI